MSQPSSSQYHRVFRHDIMGMISLNFGTQLNSVNINPCPAEPGYTLPLQTDYHSALFTIQYVNFCQVI